MPPGAAGRGPEEAPGEASSGRESPGVGGVVAAPFGKEDQEEAALPASREEALPPAPPTVLV